MITIEAIVVREISTSLKIAERVRTKQGIYRKNRNKAEEHI
jgi:hypothetical protein